MLNERIKDQRGKPKIFRAAVLTHFLARSTQLTETDGVVYEADCHMITLREGNVDIGANA